MKIVLALVDERLIHGQVLNKWADSALPDQLLIVDNELVEDGFMTNIYKALTPLWLDVQIKCVNEAVKYLFCIKNQAIRIFLLAKSPVVFESLVRLKTPIEQVILTDSMYFPNNLKIPAESKIAIRYLLEVGVSVVTKKDPGQAAREIDYGKIAEK